MKQYVLIIDGATIRDFRSRPHADFDRKNVGSHTRPVMLVLHVRLQVGSRWELTIAQFAIVRKLRVPELDMAKRVAFPLGRVVAPSALVII